MFMDSGGPERQPEIQPKPGSGIPSFLPVDDESLDRVGLAESEARWRTLLTNVPNYITIVDHDLNITFINHVVEGLSLDEVLGRSMFDFVDPRYHDIARAKLEQVFATGETVSFESLAVGPGGSEAYYESQVGPLTHKNKIVAATIVGLDITERKQTEESLRRVRDELRATLDTLPDLLFQTDRQGRYLSFHAPHAEELYVPPDQFLGKSVVEVLPPDAAEVIMAAIRETVETGRSDGRIYSLDMPEGRRWFELAMAIQDCSAEDDPRIFALVRNITARKEAEEDRLQFQEQMQHVQKLESLGVMAGGIAHDFNNLLQAILGNTDLALDETQATSGLRRSLEEIKTASCRAAELCNQLLAYSGRGQFVLEAINLSAVVEEMSHILDVTIGKRAELQYDFAADLPSILADPTQIRQVVMNLITNASEAIGDADGTISVATRVRECSTADLGGACVGEDLPAGPYVALRVADTGCGMEEEVLKKIFDPFFTTKFAGRGLGMAAVLGIVRTHQGTIDVKSTPGVGSSFEILYPVHEGDVPRQQPSGSGEVIWRGSGKILLVDDEAAVLGVARRMLEKLGFAVETASDGREALQRFEVDPGRFALVIVDLTMPHMGGVETFRSLRLRNPEARIVMSSGYAEQDAAESLLGEGLAGFLQKPYQMSELQKLLQTVLVE